jgi:methionyl-tRNA synthetase
MPKIYELIKYKSQIGGFQMSEKKKFYVTTPLYYPSGNLHIGHTYTTVAADALARFKRVMGYDVEFLTGSDEHGQKIETVANEKGVTPKEYVDGIVADIHKLWDTMEISHSIYIRTTDDYHEEAVKKIFERMYNQGDIYKGKYEGHYCTPCEAFWRDTQLVDGKCPDCGRPVEWAEEEAYFFKLSKYQDRLLDLLQNNPEFLEPASRANEMINNFLKPGLEDLCVSRTSFSWGVQVPFDPKHVVYVWLDALCNYITALGYTSDDDGKFKEYWPADVHLVGKEIVRFHTLIWPAFLMALDLPLPKKVFGHGWILFDNDKMSKSKGNVMYPEPLIELYGVDALKYFLLREFSFGSDGSFTKEKFIGRLNSDLANDLGNLVSRTAAMVVKYNDGILPNADVKTDFDDSLAELVTAVPAKMEEKMNHLNFSEALEEIWRAISRTNKYIDETEPWLLAKDEANKGKLDTVLYNLSESIRIISVLIRPFMEKTSNAIWEQFSIEEGELSNWENLSKWGVLKGGVKVTKGAVMFPRLDVKEEIDRIDEVNSALNEERNGKVKKLDHKEEITIDDFDKMELRVAEVVEAKKHPKADKLLVLQLKVGPETRQVVSGIAKHYKPEDLVGKKVVLVANLKPIKLRGIESHGMILAASDEEGFTLASTLEDIESGAAIS